MVVKSLRLTPLALALVAFGAQAQGQSDSMFSFSGFGTVGLTGTTKDGAEYVIPGQVHGADKTISGEVDSKLGLQGTAKFNSQFSATVQVLTKQNGKGNWTPQVEWAFAKWQATPDLAIRAGRMGAPFFAVSDFRDVGYANTWLRPPIDVYGQVPFSHFDGADVNWTTHIAGKTLSLQAIAGKTTNSPDTVKAEVKKLVGVNATFEVVDGLTLRAGHIQGKLTARSASTELLVNVLRQVQFPALADQFHTVDKDASFSGVGLNYDQGQWLIAAEYTKRRTDSIVPDTTGWYTTVGYRVGKFTPYATLSQQKTDNSNIDNTVPASLVVGGLPLRAVIDGVAASQSTPQKTIALGVRWDAWRNVAVKAQYDSIKTTGAGQFINAQPGFNNERVGVYSVAVDFVF